MTNELYHHGIRGQKWGKRNGPPYPLDPSDHSATEKNASRFGSSAGSSGGSKKKSKNPNRVNKVAGGIFSSRKKKEEKKEPKLTPEQEEKRRAVEKELDDVQEKFFEKIDKYGDEWEDSKEGQKLLKRIDELQDEYDSFESGGSSVAGGINSKELIKEFDKKDRELFDSKQKEMRNASSPEEKKQIQEKYDKKWDDLQAEYKKKLSVAGGTNTKPKKTAAEKGKELSEKGETIGKTVLKSLGKSVGVSVATAAVQAALAKAVSKKISESREKKRTDPEYQEKKKARTAKAVKTALGLGIGAAAIYAMAKQGEKIRQRYISEITMNPGQSPKSQAEYNEFIKRLIDKGYNKGWRY